MQEATLTIFASAHRREGASCWRRIKFWHIVPLSVGGNPRKLANLMLQPYETIEGKPGARQKDRLELKLQNMVCNEEIDLATAQREIGGDWLTAYGKYVKHKRKH